MTDRDQLTEDLYDLSHSKTVIKEAYQGVRELKDKIEDPKDKRFLETIGGTLEDYVGLGRYELSPEAIKEIKLAISDIAEITEKYRCDCRECE